MSRKQRRRSVKKIRVGPVYRVIKSTCSGCGIEAWVMWPEAGTPISSCLHCGSSAWFPININTKNMKTMTPNEAHDYALELAKELQASGIELEITLWLDKHKSRDEHYKNCVEKYGNDPKRASINKWCLVRFKTKSQEEVDLIHEKHKALSWMGVSFDSGGMADGSCRDWELDWSFSYTGKPDTEHEESIDQCKDMLDKTGNEN